MNIDEIADNIANALQKNFNDERKDLVGNIAYQAAMIGMSEQRKRDIEKAWKIMTAIVMPSNFEQFKKAMEE